jgi:tRNA(fMet)-specific endonuclease VapC
MLDTDITSYLIKGRDAALEARIKRVVPSSICLSATTKAELMYGLKKLPGNHRLHLDVRYFLKAVSVLCWDGKAADYYAEIRHLLKAAGQTIGDLDMMIAAHAMAAEAVLVTNNTRHYERIELPLILENWATRT